ncbi:MAG TPA: mycofactocin biosynthesis chaperone MftB [Acidimicrobiales bacterium]|nr:mycofactocin biosynthesis chaperone MftB [Acidimicrobiales bacterium]
MPIATSNDFDSSKAFRLSEDVSLRDESFGALAYHHVNRRLVFLKSRPLVELVRRLGEFASVNEALNELVLPAERDRYATALASLHHSDLLCG